MVLERGILPRRSSAPSALSLLSSQLAANRFCSAHMTGFQKYSLGHTHTHTHERERERERHCHSKDPHVFCILHLFVMLYIQLLRTVRYCSSWVRWFTVGIRMFYRFRV